ncbi:MAG: hypothetical protein NTV34_04905 [Proteobacteria bacterium]|nr:hypothetical protein [Pseudomonadota bacterium]
MVGRLNKGDHVLVDIAGEWARTSEGHFVSMNSLIEKGISKKKGRNAWRNSTGVEVSRKLQGKKSSGKKQKKATEQAEVEEVAPAQASAPPAAKAEGQGKAPKEAGSGDATP